MLISYKYKYFFFSQLFYKFISKFTLKGNNYKLESFFESYLYNLKLKKKTNFFLLFIECLNILKPEIGVKIFKFARNKNAKRRKKGAKLAIRTKVIPIYITKNQKYRLSLKWFVSRVKKRFKGFFSLNRQMYYLLKGNKKSIYKEKRKLRQLVIINRGAAHFRW